MAGTVQLSKYEEELTGKKEPDKPGCAGPSCPVKEER
jgi:hypothetical protein